MQPEFRSNALEISNLLVGTPDGQQIPISQLAEIRAGKRRILYLSRKQLALYRVQYSIEKRDLARAVEDGQKAIRNDVVIPGVTCGVGRRIRPVQAAKAQLSIIGPVASC